MPIELKIPTVGESITEVQVGQWLKGEGDWADKDQPLVEIESEKATIEIVAPEAGRVSKVLKQQGQAANVGEVIGYLDAAQQPGGKPDDQQAGGKEPGGKQPPGKQADGKQAEGKQAEGPEPAAHKKPAPAQAGAPSKEEGKRRPQRAELERAQQELRPSRKESARQEPRPETPPPQPRPAPGGQPSAGAVRPDEQEAQEPSPDRSARVMPAARRALAEHGLTAEEVQATGPGGRLLKEDVQRHVEQSADKPEVVRQAPPSNKAQPPATQSSARAATAPADRDDEIVPMTPLRRRVAERLVEAQRVAALLTTFNEVDMSAVMALRQKHKDEFQEKHGAKLGFMSFFVKAVIEALKETPRINSEIRGTDIVYHNYFDIGIAVAGGKGLVVPVLHDADRMSFAEIEQAIAELATRARANKLLPRELEGGTFTISNGGVYGSLLSTPIVNPPQSGILGLHAIQERPVARDGQVVIRPMMYVALTYDHRIVDGREAVLFLRHIKQCIEEPSRMLLEI